MMGQSLSARILQNHDTVASFVSLHMFSALSARKNLYR